MQPVQSEVRMLQRGLGTAPLSCLFLVGGSHTNRQGGLTDLHNAKNSRELITLLQLCWGRPGFVPVPQKVAFFQHGNDPSFASLHSLFT